VLYFLEFVSVCNVQACAAVVGAAVLPIHRVLWCHALAADLLACTRCFLMLFDTSAHAHPVQSIHKM